MKRQVRIYLFSLAIILFLATSFRFYKLRNSDFISADEYIYYKGVDIAAAFKKVLFNFNDALRSGDIMGLIRELPAYAKPGYHFFAAIATFILGESKTTALYLSAFFGVLTIIATYLVAQLLFNSQRTALIASLLLAVSSGHLLYSRMAIQISGAIFFLLISFFFYVKSRKEIKRSNSFLIASALFYALSFAVHPSVIYCLPAFILLELHRSLLFLPDSNTWDNIQSLLKNLFLFFGVFLLGIIIWEVPRFLTHLYFILKGRISLFSNYFTALVPINNVTSYLDELSVIWRQHSYIRQDYNFLYFPSFLIDSQGKIYFFILIISIVYFVLKLLRQIKDYRYLLLAAWVGTVYILYSLPIGNRELRVYITTLPALSIIQALFFDSLISTFKGQVIKTMGIAITLLLVIYSSIVYCFEIINSQLSYKPVKDYLEANPSIDKVLLNVDLMGNGPSEKVYDWSDSFVIAGYTAPGMSYTGGKARIAVFYRNKEELLKNPIIIAGRTWISWPDDIKKLYKEGKARYLLTSMFDYIWFKKSPFKKEPIFYYPSPFVCKARVYENSHGISNLKEYDKELYFKRIGIYDLSDILELKNPIE